MVSILECYIENIFFYGKLVYMLVFINSMVGFVFLGYYFYIIIRLFFMK